MLTDLRKLQYRSANIERANPVAWGFAVDSTADHQYALFKLGLDPNKHRVTGLALEDTQDFHPSWSLRETEQLVEAYISKLKSWIDTKLSDSTTAMYATNPREYILTCSGNLVRPSKRPHQAMRRKGIRSDSFFNTHGIGARSRGALCTQAGV